eukprot:scaffold133711_cov17-Tisochrysis_lutea.AAC.1
MEYAADFEHEIANSFRVRLCLGRLRPKRVDNANYNPNAKYFQVASLPKTSCSPKSLFIREASATRAHTGYAH